ncbi:MAG: DUF4397 domain-containing protein [Gemmatimonadota bacterium]|nr:DUF4397 domain-containing protein [Gemmatimonadota bacterium]
MQFQRILLAGFASLALAACNDDPVSREVAPEASAQVRWVNAVSDTVAMDYRFVTYPSNASQAGLAFRANSGNWRRVPAGTHRVRVFFTNSTAAGQAASVVSQVFVDTTFSLEAEKKYTILHYGYTKASATPKHRLIVIEDVLPTVPAGQIAVRAVNAAPAFGTVNIFASTATATGGAATGSPVFSNVAPGAVTSWVNLPVATGTNSYRVAATAPASTDALADLLAPAGTAATAATATSAALDAIAGTRQGTSALTVVIFGPQVAYVLRTPTGTSSSVAATTTGGVGVLLDAHPARISP